MAPRSCASRLHELQKDFGLKESDLRRAVHEACAPREVKLPTFHEKVKHRSRFEESYERDTAKARRYQLAHWYLEEYLSDNAARKLYLEHPDFKDLVEVAYERAVGTIQIITMRVPEEVDLEQLFPDPTVPTDWDIPDIRWKEFSVYAKKHGLDGPRDVLDRRYKFHESTRKKRKKFYSRRSLRMYDPLFANSAVSEKEMLKNIKQISRENELRVIKFNEMLNKLVSDRSVGSNAMKAFNRQTEVIMDNYQKRMKDLMRRTKAPPASVIFDSRPYVG